MKIQRNTGVNGKRSEHRCANQGGTAEISVPFGIEVLVVFSLRNFAGKGEKKWQIRS